MNFDVTSSVLFIVPVQPIQATYQSPAKNVVSSPPPYVSNTDQTTPLNQQVFGARSLDLPVFGYRGQKEKHRIWLAGQACRCDESSSSHLNACPSPHLLTVKLNVQRKHKVAIHLQQKKAINWYIVHSLMIWRHNLGDQDHISHIAHLESTQFSVWLAMLTNRPHTPELTSTELHLVRVLTLYAMVEWRESRWQLITLPTPLLHTGTNRTDCSLNCKLSWILSHIYNRIFSSYFSIDFDEVSVL